MDKTRGFLDGERNHSFGKLASMTETFEKKGEFHHFSFVRCDGDYRWPWFQLSTMAPPL